MGELLVGDSVFRFRAAEQADACDRAFRSSAAGLLAVTSFRNSNPKLKCHSQRSIDDRETSFLRPGDRLERYHLCCSKAGRCDAPHGNGPAEIAVIKCRNVVWTLPV